MKLLNNRILLKYIIFILLLLITSFQSLIFIILDGEYIQNANETVGYRYFYAERALSGDPVVVGVGYLVGILHEISFLIVNNYIKVTLNNLNIAINLFANITNFLILIVQCLIVTSLYFSNRINKSQKILLICLLLCLQYGFGFQSVIYVSLPDYLHLNMIIAFFLVYIFFLNINDEKRILNSLINYILSIIMGILLSNKISLLPLITLAMSPLLFYQAKNFRNKLFILILLFSVALVSYFLTHLIFYAGNINNLITALPVWIRFISNPGGDSAWLSIMLSEIKSFNYLYYYIIYAIVFLTSYFNSRNSYHNKYIYFNLLVFIFLVYAVYKRPATTTLFESTQWILCISAMMIGTSSHKLTKIIFCLSIICLSVVTFPRPEQTISFFNESHMYFEEKRVFFERANYISKNKKTIVFLEDNSYHHEGFHELFLKGASDFPSWEVTSGITLLNKYLGNIEYRTLMASDSNIKFNSVIDDNAVVICFQKPDEIDLPFKNKAILEFSSQKGIQIEKYKFNGGGAYIMGIILYKNLN